MLTGPLPSAKRRQLAPPSILNNKANQDMYGLPRAPVGHSINGRAKVATITRVGGRKQMISWVDAPDDVFFVATENTRLVICLVQLCLIDGITILICLFVSQTSAKTINSIRTARRRQATVEACRRKTSDCKQQRHGRFVHHQRNAWQRNHVRAGGRRSDDDGLKTFETTKILNTMHNYCLAGCLPH